MDVSWTLQTKLTKERKEIFLGFLMVNRKEKKREFFLLFLQIKKEQRRTGKNSEKIKENTMMIQWKGRRVRTPPNLGYWPKSGSATAGPKSFLRLRGSTGTSTRRTRSRVRRRTSCYPPKKKDPRPKKKVPRPTRKQDPTGGVESPPAPPEQHPPWGCGTAAERRTRPAQPRWKTICSC